MAAQKGGLLGEQTAELREVDSAPIMMADNVRLEKGVGSCARCGQRLTDPHSVARHLGPVCYRRCGGGAFDGELQVGEEEWQRREQLLQRGGEHDFGYWDCVYAAPDAPEPMILTHAMRVTVRFRDGAYEAVGVILFGHGVLAERTFYRGPDVRQAWAAAVAAGPESTAIAERCRGRGGRRG